MSNFFLTLVNSSVFVVLLQVAVLTQAQCIVRSKSVITVGCWLLATTSMVAIAAHTLRVEGFGCVGTLSDFLILFNTLR